MHVELSIQVLDALGTPVILFQQNGSLSYANQSARELLGETSESWHWPEICEQLPQSHIHRLYSYETEDHVGIIIECIPHQESTLQTENLILKKQVDELESIIHASSDELFVTDGEGRILLVTKRVKEVYGLADDEIIGRTVFELEQAGVFYPSVTAVVLRDRRRHTILQTTRDGRHLAVTGNPLFDDSGTITRVISTAIDMQEMPWLMTPPLSSLPTAKKSPDRIDHNSFSCPFVASSPLMRNFTEHTKHIAKTDATILLLGETGVGKNRLARYIHSESARASGPFVEINCAALPESLMESELFGYERGAFTGSAREGKVGKVEIAHQGTLFLNEIGELPLHTQAKLLDFVQDRHFTRVGGVKTCTVDVRIISATNRNLEQMVQEKLFRTDLFYRLHVVPLEIPPLRERPEDMEALCLTILTDITRRYHLPIKHVHHATLAMLRDHHWPGNVRELENLLERVCVSTNDSLILPTHLPLAFHGAAHLGTNHYLNFSKQATITDKQGDNNIGKHSLQAQMDHLEAEILRDALTRWKTTYTIAQHLNISQPTVVRKLKQHGLSTR